MEIEHTLSPEESLRLISQAIDKTKENIAKNSFTFLLWGWLIVIASFAFFALQQFTTFDYYFIPFPVLSSIGLVATVIHHYKRHTEITETYIDHFLSRMWAVLGIGFITVVFVNVSQGNTPFTYTLVMGGLGTLISGLVLKFKPLLCGGLLLLTSAVASIYMDEDHRVLLHGMAVACGYLLPGYLLKRVKG